MKLLYLLVDGKRVDKDFPKILESKLKDYFTPEIEDPIWEFQFEEDFSLYALASNVVFAVEGEPLEKEVKNGDKVVGLKGRIRSDPSEESGPFKPTPDKGGGKIA